MTKPMDHPTIHTAIAAVMESLQFLKKGERNQGQNFNFRGIDAVMNAVGPRFREHGLYLIPKVESIDVTPGQTKNGMPLSKSIAVVKYTITHAQTGSTIEGVSVGEANDMADKATAKAMSVALRTFLLQLLMLPTQEPDPDLNMHVQYPVDSGAPGLDHSAFIESGQHLTGSREQLLDAMQAAREAGDQDGYKVLMEAGKSRFSTSNKTEKDK